jgi:hypothetical protein
MTRSRRNVTDSDRNSADSSGPDAVHWLARELILMQVGAFRGYPILFIVNNILIMGIEVFDVAVFHYSNY